MPNVRSCRSRSPAMPKTPTNSSTSRTQALGYRKEHNDGFVHQIIAASKISEDDVVEVRDHLQFHDGATGPVDGNLE